MATHYSQLSVLVYQETNIGKYRTVRHWERSKIVQGKPYLERVLNLSKDQGFARSAPSYWLKEKKGGKLSKNSITGLFATSFRKWYWGFRGKRKDLILFCLRSNQMIIFYFPDFYTSNHDEVLKQIAKKYPQLFVEQQLNKKGV